MRIVEALGRFVTWWPLPLAATLAGSAMVYSAEGGNSSIWFMGALIVAMVAALFALTRRLATAVWATWSVVTVATAISTAKLEYMGVTLLAFDVWFYLADTSIVAFLLDQYRLAVLGVGAALAALVFVTVLAHRFEPPVTRPRLVTAGVAVAVAASVVAADRFPVSRGDPQSYFVTRHRSSSFFVSLRDVGRAVFGPAFARGLSPSAAEAGYAREADCVGGGRPDIVVALMESTMPPSIYPDLKVPADLDSRFRDGAGRLHRLRVETYGGATWVSTVGFLTGLPTIEFGWMRQYLTDWLKGRIHHSLIRRLEDCGYRTAVISPMRYEFGHEGPFMVSLGVDDYRDRSALPGVGRKDRDAAYFAAVRRLIDEHRGRDGRPLFVYLMTMAAHGPYDTRFAPEVVAAGEPFGNDPQVDEYLRRIVLERDDLDRFIADLSAAPGPRGTLLLEFGDHQSSATRGHAEARAPDALGDWGSIAYLTYYRLTRFGLPPAEPPPDVEALDIAYLGPVLQAAAGLPLDAIDAEMMRLALDCGGAFTACPDRARVDRHLARLVAGGHVVLPTVAGAGATPAPPAR